MDTPTSSNKNDYPNKNLKVLTNTRQIHRRQNGDAEFDLKVEIKEGKVRLTIKAKEREGFPGIILNLEPRVAASLGISLLTKSEEIQY